MSRRPFEKLDTGSFQDLIDEFLLSLANRSTVKNYRTEFRSLDDWFSPFTGVECRVEMLKFFRARQATIGPASLRQSAMRVRKFFEYLVSNGFRPDNPVADISFVPRFIDERVPRSLTIGDLEKLKSVFSTDTWQDLRDWCAISLMLFDGLRIAEVTMINRGDLEQVDDNTHRCLIRGKCGRLSHVFIFPQTMLLLQKFIDMSEFVSADSPLISSAKSSGQRLHTRSLRKRIECWFKRAGIKRAGMCAHALRHTHASVLHSKGVPISTIQARLRHSSIETTFEYLKNLPATFQPAAADLHAIFDGLALTE